MIGGWEISGEIVLWWMPLNFADDKSTLIQVMAWCHHFAIIPFLAIRSLQIFAQVTTAQLSGHVQIFVVIIGGLLSFTYLTAYGPIASKTASWVSEYWQNFLSNPSDEIFPYVKPQEYGNAYIDMCAIDSNAVFIDSYEKKISEHT